MTDMAAAAATILALVCDIQGVVHVAADTHSSAAIGITIRGEQDRAEVERLLEGTPHSTVISSTVGFGDFTGDTLATKWATVAGWWGYRYRWPAPIQRYRNRLMKDAMRREEEAFAAMDEEAKNQAIADLIARRREQGHWKFGNCWTGPVSPINATVQALHDGLEAMQAKVQAAALEMPGVIDATTGIDSSARTYVSIVTVTTLADEDKVARQLTAINGGAVVYIN